MDYETQDGSQFSLREVCEEGDRGSSPVFAYTSISAIVEGKAYTGMLPERASDLDDGDILAALQLVPSECIHPRFQAGFTVAPAFDPAEHYLKAPSFTYEDCQPGKTFVADCLLNEVRVLERLRAHPHPALVVYHGCVVREEEGVVTHICLQRLPHRLDEFVESLASSSSEIDEKDEQIAAVLESIQAGIQHLHSLGLAHNDVNPYNICLTDDAQPVIVDFDSCLPLGESLMKGGEPPKSGVRIERFEQVSSVENDIRGLDSIQDFLRYGMNRDLME